MGIYGDEKEMKRKYTTVLSAQGGEAEILEKIKDLYASIIPWVMEEEDDTPFTDWKGVD